MKETGHEATSQIEGEKPPSQGVLDEPHRDPQSVAERFDPVFEPPGGEHDAHFGVGEDVLDLADFYRKVWALGEAGVSVPLTVLRGAELTEVSITSGDRYDYLKLDPSY